jgi:hypothetical protein
MTIRKELIISLDDIQFIRISCPHCNTTISLDIKSEFEPSPQRPYFAPDACSVCHKPFDTAIHNIAKFQQAYHALRAVKETLSFNGQAEDAKPADD